MRNPLELDQVIYTPNEKKPINICISSCASFDDGKKAIGISHCESGLPLDITRGLEVWCIVQFHEKNVDEIQFEDESLKDSWLQFIGGSGVGKFKTTGAPCLSEFTYELLKFNLIDLIPDGLFLSLEVIFPEGKKLAERTSNKSFGVVDGLSIIGTQPESQISASPDQLKKTINELRRRCEVESFSGDLIFVIGENGLDLAVNLGFSPISILKVGNWLGPLLVAAAEAGVKKLLLFGYHGKLIKLAGGVFHTHHHLADARLEILTYLAVKEGLPLPVIQAISKALSMEEALFILESKYSEVVKRLWLRVGDEIETKSQTYVSRYVSSSMEIGSALFDKQRNLRWGGSYGINQLKNLGVTTQS